MITTYALNRFCSHKPVLRKLNDFSMKNIIKTITKKQQNKNQKWNEIRRRRKHTTELTKSTQQSSSQINKKKLCICFSLNNRRQNNNNEKTKKNSCPSSNRNAQFRMVWCPENEMKEFFLCFFFFEKRREKVKIIRSRQNGKDCLNMSSTNANGVCVFVCLCGIKVSSSMTLNGYERMNKYGKNIKWLIGMDLICYRCCQFVSFVSS